MSPIRFYSGVFLLTCATLVVEIVETRLLSVITWYHLAFFVVSAAMFGMTAGAVWLYLRRDRFTEQSLPNDLARFSMFFALSVGVSLAFQTTMHPVMVLSVPGAVLVLEMALALAVPFFCSGVAIGLALTRSPFPVARVYAVDLLGAAVGCLGVLLLLKLLDASSVLLLAGGLAAMAAWLFASAGASCEPASQPASRRRLVANPLLVCLGLVVLSAVNGMTDKGIRPIFVKSRIERPGDLFRDEWNSFSRVVAVRPTEETPRLWGPSPKMPPDTRCRSVRMAIDGGAGTWMFHFQGDLAEVDFLKYDITNLAYYLRNSGRSAVIGVGGGRDMLSAWLFGFRDVTGVEINPVFIKWLKEDPFLSRFSRLADLQGVHLVLDEARSWFARSDEAFDSIQMSMIDTWAATGAGAFTLSENGLYTLEAWSIFISRLKERGVFTVSRWYASDEINETGRMVSLATGALLEMGVERPREHLFVAAVSGLTEARQELNMGIATLILSRSPLTSQDVETLTKICRELDYEILLSPGVPSSSEVVERIAQCSSLEELDEFANSLKLNLSPPTDDTPFFFNLLRLGNPFKTLAIYRETRGAGGVLRGNLQATLTLLMIFVVSIILVIATIVVPLWSTTTHVNNRLILGGTCYFGCLGVGFMLVEIGMLQRLSVFLGHPVYSLSIVLFSLILSTGIGSYFCDKLRLHNRRRFTLWAIMTSGYVAGLVSLLPLLCTSFEHAATLWKAAIAVMTLVPAGFLMGFGFPTGMHVVESLDKRATPWFWGINGAGGVLASVLAVAVSITAGISVTLFIGAACYVVLIPAFVVMRFSRTAVAQ